jgi:hypothetical protein
MAYFAHLNGLRIVTARILLPAWGAWSGDVQLAEDTAITGPATVTIGNLSLVGAAYRDGAFAGSRSTRLVGGAGGWRRTVPRRFYADTTNGVKLATVARDVAAEAGETVANVPAGTVGSYFTRCLAPASRCLALLVGREGWYIDNAGVTQLAARPATTIASPFTVVQFRPDWGEVWIATEDPAAWMPGAVFSSATVPAARTVASSSVVLDKGSTLRVEAMLS